MIRQSEEYEEQIRNQIKLLESELLILGDMDKISIDSLTKR